MSAPVSSPPMPSSIAGRPGRAAPAPPRWPRPARAASARPAPGRGAAGAAGGVACACARAALARTGAIAVRSQPRHLALGVLAREEHLVGQAASRRSRGRAAESSSSSSWLPRAATRPSSSTTISSASAIVDSRCAITNVVRPSITSARADLMRLSVVASTLEVASSRIRMRGSASSARAIATRWRWPPLRVRPRSPTSVSRPSGRSSSELAQAGALRRGQRPRRRRPRDARRRCCRAAWRRTGTRRRRPAPSRAAARRGRRAHVDAVHQHAAARDVVEARDQHHERGLAGAGGAHQRHRARRPRPSGRCRAAAASPPS